MLNAFYILHTRVSKAFLTGKKEYCEILSYNFMFLQSVKAQNRL